MTARMDSLLSQHNLLSRHIIVMQASDKRTMLAQIKKQRIVNSGNTTHMKSDTINTRSNFGQQDEGILLDV